MIPLEIVMKMTRRRKRRKNIRLVSLTEDPEADLLRGDVTGVLQRRNIRRGLQTEEEEDHHQTHHQEDADHLQSHPQDVREDLHLTLPQEEEDHLPTHPEGEGVLHPTHLQEEGDLHRILHLGEEETPGVPHHQRRKQVWI